MEQREKEMMQPNEKIETAIQAGTGDKNTSTKKHGSTHD
jgi:hypothetical protein